MALLSYINEPDSFGSLSVVLLKKYFGDAVVQWELEALWKTLSDLKVDLSDEAKAKTSAFIALHENPMAIWELNAFQNTVAAAGNIVPLPEIVQQLYPFELGWGIIEMSEFFVSVKNLDAKTSIKWGDDIISYIAACLRADGWFLAPKPLDFVQDTLDSINKNKELLNKNPQSEEMKFQISRLGDYQASLANKFAVYKNQKTKV